MGSQSNDRVNGRAPQNLNIRQLSKNYAEHVALADVSITVEPGKFLTLLGPSGSGKTTLLMAVAGFVVPTSGTILLGNSDITNLPPERRSFGMVFQGYALFPTMTVEENIWFPLRVRGIKKADARQAIARSLDLVKLSHLADRMPSQLSGGQQQRVALARALVFEPSLLLLDEPLSALDRQLRAELQWELRSLHRRLGVTFINVTHDQEEALSMSDEIIILRNGRIEQSGRPTELYSRPSNRFVANFLGESNFISGRMCQQETDRFHIKVGDLKVTQAGKPRDTTADADVLLAIRPEKLTLSSNRPTKENAIPGTVADFKYQGSGHEVRVSTEAFGTLVVKAAAGQADGSLDIGSKVWLGWDPDAAVPVDEA